MLSLLWSMNLCIKVLSYKALLNRHNSDKSDTLSSNFCRHHNFCRKVTSLQVEEHRFLVPDLGCSLPFTILLVQSIAAAQAGVTQAPRPMINMMYLAKPADKMNYQLEGITVLSYSSFVPLTGRGWISSGCPSVSKDFLTQRSFQNFFQKTRLS